MGRKRVHDLKALEEKIRKTRVAWKKEDQAKAGTPSLSDRDKFIERLADRQHREFMKEADPYGDDDFDVDQLEDDPDAIQDHPAYAKSLDFEESYFDEEHGGEDGQLHLERIRRQFSELPQHEGGFSDIAKYPALYTKAALRVEKALAQGKPNTWETYREVGEGLRMELLEAEEREFEQERSNAIAAMATLRKRGVVQEDES